MLADIQVALHTIASQDLIGLRELNNYWIRLTLRMLPDKVKIAPEKVFEMTRCRCLATHCNINMWRCVKMSLKCTNFCECNETNCENLDYKVLLSNDSDCYLSDDSESDD